MGCLGKDVEVALVDDAGGSFRARGELRYSRHQGGAFDCGLTPSTSRGDVNCENNTLQIAPVYNDDDELEIRFELEDGSFSDWQPVPLTIETRTLPDFNGPDCDCTVHDGTAAPVTVPEGARLID